LVAAQLVAHYLARSRYPASNECELRAGIHGVLLAHFQHVTWEACRTDHHRPEFSVAVGDTVVAVAVSLTGDCTAILRRSRRSPTWCDIDALVIASPRRLLSAGLLSEIRGKPILLATVGRAS
jgi:hypothetical protein